MNRSESMNRVLSFVGGVGLGLGMMYLLDPAQGGRRRALLRDRAVRGSNRLRTTLANRGRELRDRARAVAAAQQSQPGAAGLVPGASDVLNPLEPHEDPEQVSALPGRRFERRRMAQALTDPRMRFGLGVVGLTAAVLAVRAIQHRTRNQGNESGTPAYVHSPLQEAHVY